MPPVRRFIFSDIHGNENSLTNVDVDWLKIRMQMRYCLVCYLLLKEISPVTGVTGATGVSGVARVPGEINYKIKTGPVTPVTHGSLDFPGKLLHLTLNLWRGRTSL